MMSSKKIVIDKTKNKERNSSATKAPSHKEKILISKQYTMMYSLTQDLVPSKQLCLIRP